MSIKCWIVMGNDHPVGVFASALAAEDFILFQKWWHKVNADHQVPTYWRHYAFDLNTEYTPTTLLPGRGKKFKDMMSDELKTEWWYWYSKEYGKSGSAAGASSEFRREIETELRVRGVPVESLREYYNLVLDGSDTTVRHRRDKT